MATGEPRSALTESFAPGTMLGRYELIATIGKGGMANVILARQRGPAGFEKAVVIKVIHPHRATDRHAIEMLLDEAKLAARIDHPNVVHTYELGEAHGTYYIVMEYLAGESFTQLLRRAFDGRQTRLHPFLAARIVAEVAGGLHAAHELVDVHGHSLGIVHRDVSPGNIVVLYNGAVKVVDFGIAKAHGRVTSTQDGELKGKYGYMSPEQIENAPMDRRSDVFSLGVVLWESLALRRLFAAENVGATLMQILAARRVPPSTHSPDVPPGLDAIAVKALARDPRDRFQSAAEMKAAIEDVIWQVRCGTAEIATHMTTLFPDRIEQRRSLLARAAAHDSIVAVLDTLDATSFMDQEPTPQPATTPQPVVAPAVLAPTVPMPAFEPLPSVALVPRAPSPRWRLPVVIAIAGIVVGGVTAAIVGYADHDALPSSAPPPAPTAEHASSPPTVEPIAVVEPPAPVPVPAPVNVEPAPVVTAPVPSPPPVVAEVRSERPSPPRHRAPDHPRVVDDPPVELPTPPVASPTPPPVVAEEPAVEPDESADELYKQATTHYLAARFAAAERSFKQALAVDRRYAPAYRGLGVLYQRIGRSDKAIAALTRYLELAPGASDTAAIRKRLDQLQAPQ